MNKPFLAKTRFAPTPSGFLHLGNIYSFAVTAALAKRNGAKIMLRIDDLFRENCDTQHVQGIMDTLDFLGIHWDEGPKNMGEFEQVYSQWNRMVMYNEVLNELQASGRVFACTCSRSQVERLNADHTYPGTCCYKKLPLDTKGACWRLHTDEEHSLIVNTPSGQVPALLPHAMRNFVVRKKDGCPGYQLTSLLDDIHFGVDLVVRGQDLWNSTLAQLYLSVVLGRGSFGGTTFYHHSLMMAPDGGKLSKSGGATTIHYLRQQGKLPSDIFSLIAGMAAITGEPQTWEELLALVNGQIGL